MAPDVNVNFFNKATTYAKGMKEYTDKTTVLIDKSNSALIDFDGDGKVDKTLTTSEYASDTVTLSNKKDDLASLLTRKQNLEYDQKNEKDQTKLAKVNQELIQVNDKIKNSGASADEMKKAQDEVKLRDLMEQKFVLNFELTQTKDAPSLAKIKNQLARLQKEIDKLQVSQTEQDAITKSIGGEDTTLDLKPDNEPPTTAPEPQTAATSPYTQGATIKVTNEKNPNGSIDGTVTNIAHEGDSVTSITIKSKKSGKDFTYNYDAKTGCYVNANDPNKFYKIQKDGSLARDNTQGITPPPPPPATVVKEVELSDGSYKANGKWYSCTGRKLTGTDLSSAVKRHEIDQTIAKNATVFDGEGKPLDLEISDLMPLNGKYVDRDGFIYERKNNKFTQVAAMDSSKLPPFKGMNAETTKSPKDSSDKEASMPNATALEKAKNKFVESATEHKVSETLSNGYFKVQAKACGLVGRMYFDKDGTRIPKSDYDHAKQTSTVLYTSTEATQKKTEETSSASTNSNAEGIVKSKFPDCKAVKVRNTLDNGAFVADVIGGNNRGTKYFNGNGEQITLADFQKLRKS